MAALAGSRRCLAFSASSSSARSRRCAVAVRATVESLKATPVKAQAFLDQMQSFGKCRFIVVGEGAILESVADVRKTKLTQTPRGPLATISSDDKTFECHIYLDKVKQAKLVRTMARTGDYELFVTRLLDQDEKVLLTCLLHGQQGKYDADAVQGWEAMHAQYGDLVNMA